MESTDRISIPKMMYPKRPREDTVTRLRVAADEATGNMDRFVRRGKADVAQYYAGRRDGLLEAIRMLERE